MPENACNTALRLALVRAGSWRLHFIAVGLVTAMHAALPNPAQAQGSMNAAQAQALHDEAQKLMAAKKYEEACPKLAESQRLDPGIGTLLRLARCYEKIGKTASAWVSLVEAESLARKNKDDREHKAKALAAQLVPKLTRLTVVVPASVASIPGLEVRLEGALIGKAQWGQPLPADPGTYRIEATAAGKETWSTLVEIAGVGKTIPVEIPLLEDAPAPSAGAGQDTPALENPSDIEDSPDGTGETAPDTGSNGPRSHAGQLGLFYRVDVDGKLRGQVSAFGLSYGIANHLDVAAAGLVGKDKGVWAGGTGYLLQGKWKPRLTLGTHIFFAEGVQVGLHAAGGVQWDPTHHVGLFLDAGVSYWPNPRENYEPWVFVPSAGIQGRL